MLASKTNLKTSSFPFWLWPSLLSLDAPLVAVFWQVALARSLRVRVLPVLTIALAIAVWSIYVLDRVLDGPAELSMRHLFAAFHRKTLVAAVALVNLLALVALLPLVPGPFVIPGLCLALVCAAYLIASQAIFPGAFTKSVAMSLLFGAGVVLPFSGASVPLAFAATAIVVFANTQLLVRWQQGARASIAGRLGLIALALAGPVSADRYLIALSLGCGAMLALDVAGERIQLDLRRCLVDAVLVVTVLISL